MQLAEGTVKQVMDFEAMLCQLMLGREDSLAAREPDALVVIVVQEDVQGFLLPRLEDLGAEAAEMPHVEEHLVGEVEIPGQEAVAPLVLPPTRPDLRCLVSRRAVMADGGRPLGLDKI